MIEFDMAKLIFDQVVSHAKKGKHVIAELVEQIVEEEDEQIEQAYHEATSIADEAKVPTPTSTSVIEGSIESLEQ
ncbi:hypothetical protein PVK06_017542 [Gossypium arboreum]|uniref:Uncharacterized protein n=1 Tax=Gossypium arboreum TaxID=29729 RepID=A0ABR0Q3P0_GOSAR|nr:hypothetical protein PVK06_017542 [Gossypium arboreum]